MLTLGDKLARQCQEAFPDGALMILQGQLGAGKTTLVRGFLQALGHVGTVRSPTYTLVESYMLSRTVHHFDLYRISDADELELTGFHDYLKQNAFCLIEWPECYPDLLSEADIRVMIEYHDDGRDVTIEIKNR